MDKGTMLECLINHYTDCNKAAFARKLGVSPQVLSHWIGRKTFDNELIYQKCEGISAHWLLTGEGEMFEAPSAPTISQTVTASSHVTQTAGAPAETPAAINALLAAKDETIAALRQSLADKERLICTLLEARSPQNP